MADLDPETLVAALRHPDLTAEEFKRLVQGDFGDYEQQVMNRLLQDAPFRQGYDTAMQRLEPLRELLRQYDAAVTGLRSGVQLGGTHLAVALDFANQLPTVPDDLWDDERTYTP